MTTLTLCSDLHGFRPALEYSDILIIAGDLTGRDTLPEYEEFDEWLENQPCKHKIIIGGNHDNILYKEKYKIKNGTYLFDSNCEVLSYQIFGSPWTKTFPGMNPHCKAFTVDNEEELAGKFSLIPEDIDILITHSPPYGILDETERGECVGSKELLKAMLKVRPRLMVFGHIHEQGGKSIDLTSTICINACYVNERYRPVNKLIRIELW